MYFFTSVTSNYIPKARVLAYSVKRHNPDARFFLVLSDRLPEGFALENEPFDRILTVEELALPVASLDAWIFKHSVVELCTAVKGQAFLRIFDTTDAQKVVYLDPDTAVFHPLTELDALLDRHEVILTPHLTDPNKTRESILDNEISTLKHGVYNLGFLAIRRGPEGLRFVRWWRDRLLEFCYDDIPNGLFTDQKWVDMAPALFDVHVLKERTYNVATWNVDNRPVEADAQGKPFIHGVPLKFFHFSGFDSGAHVSMLAKYGEGSPALHALSEWYMRAIEEQGQSAMGKIPCIYGTFSNGEPISRAHRLLYRTRLDLQQAFPQPSQVSNDGRCYRAWYATNGGALRVMAAPGLTMIKRMIPLKLKQSLKNLYLSAARS